MTFKHVKFEDSAVMRSLERMAREKGLVPNEPARVKTASAPDLGFPQSSTLMENILRLCAGLRHAGFEKHAQDVEEKFLAFKQAQTLYETSSEKGEDLVDAAHPKGSHKLENVDGDESVFETILDQHLAHLKMIDKQPTGKLANNNSILSAVKKVLAQAQEESEALAANLSGELNKLRGALRRVDTLTSDELTVPLHTGYVPNLEKLVSNPTLDNLKEAKKVITKMRWRLKPGSIFGLSEDTWVQVEPLQTACETAIDAAIGLRSKIVQLKSKIIADPEQAAQPKPQAPPPNVVLQKIQEARRSLNGIQGLVSADLEADPADKTQIQGWIAKVGGALEELEKNYATKSPEDVEAALVKLTKDFARVRQEWA